MLSSAQPASRKGNKKPENSVSSSRVLPLRGKHEESNFLKLEIPIVLVNNDKGGKHIVINPTSFPYFLNLNQSDIETLKQSGLMEKSAPKFIPKRINYGALATEYKHKIESGEFSNRSALARSLGVSRSWVTQVLGKRI